ncbi:RNA-binding protein Y14 [Fusarium heterosporum]|uniref:RNA-binding protein Y14 n=1 Tax=Fusarium heterosporum TaxID=42747 RepID=A0A8H5X3Q1_FUSHE|nr:RNA-binding protein Y14 [Fusarium heterosporum]
MASRSPSRGRNKSRTRSRSRSPTPRSEDSRSPQRRPHHDSRSPARSLSPQRRNGRYRSRSRSQSRSRSRSRSHGGRERNGRDRSGSPPVKSTKIVVERLSKNINEQHLYEIFGQFGRIKDLDLPINRTFGTNRGTAYILYDYEDDAETAIAHMHEAQVDGSAINVSIVLPRRKLSPAPPTARRGANIDPRVPFAGARGGAPALGNNNTGGGGGRRRTSPGSRYGPRSDVYRPGSRSPSRSPARPPSRGGGSPQVPGAKDQVATTMSHDAVAASIVIKVEAGLVVEGAAPNRHEPEGVN